MFGDYGIFNGIPTVFDFPSHLKKTLPERKPLMKRKLTETDEDENEQSASVEINKSSSTEVLKFKVEEYRTKIKVLLSKKCVEQIIYLIYIINDTFDVRYLFCLFDESFDLDLRDFCFVFL